MNTSENEYELLDSGNGKKLERFGEITLSRPCAQAVWEPRRPDLWEKASASFNRKDGLNWSGRNKLPNNWIVPINGISMKLSTTDFGHLGVFPETRALWSWITKTLSEMSQAKARKLNFLNLFAYSGGATLAAAKAGAEACHLDASRGMVEWARENARINELQNAPVRWIVDDVHKFLNREIRRERKYDAILLDPPSFGRGKKGELYKVEQNLLQTLNACKAVLSNDPAFVILTSHTPGLSPIVLKNLCAQVFGPGKTECGEMLLTGGPDVLEVPNGNWAKWIA